MESGQSRPGQREIDVGREVPRQVVLYAVGSPLVVDFEESLARAGVRIVAAVRNVPGEVHLLDRRPLLAGADLTESLKATPYLVPLFTPANRRHAAEEARTAGFRRAFSLVDPSVALPRAFQAGAGLYINAGCSIGAACELEEFVLINRGACLGHHARLGRFVSIGPGAVVGSLVEIGSEVLIGAGAVVLPKVRIGASSVVGAGSVVTEDVPEQCVVVGNPARLAKQRVPLDPHTAAVGPAGVRSA